MIARPNSSKQFLPFVATVNNEGDTTIYLVLNDAKDSVYIVQVIYFSHPSFLQQTVFVYRNIILLRKQVKRPAVDSSLTAKKWACRNELGLAVLAHPLNNPSDSSECQLLTLLLSSLSLESRETE